MVNLLGIEPNTLTGVPMVFTDVYYLLILLTSYIYSSTVLKLSFK